MTHTAQMLECDKTTCYPAVEPNPDFAKIEEKVLAGWKQTGAFQRSIDQRPASNEYVFYDGPPFANGLPHYGHLLTGYVKDLFARYHTMRGSKVDRRFGWDCHGLPAEMGAEKGLNISGRKAIEDYGIGKFNDYCRSSVMKYAGEWEHYVDRQARWVDFQNDYKTMDKNFMESVLWAFKQLYDKGLIYESHRVMPYSWAAETPLSNFETKLDNSYRTRTDKAVTVKFKLKERPKGAPEAENYYLLAWTTTPWTLPSNLALAVGKAVTYRTQIKNGDCYIHSSTSADKLLTVLGEEKEGGSYSAKNVSEISYENLIGLTYEPLFPYFANHPNAFRVLDGSSFITEGDGTGIVHMAPGFGEDDQRVCAENGISVVVPVDESGRYTDEIFDLGAKTYQLKPNSLLETQRLYARPFAQADYPLFQSLIADPEVAKTTSDGILPEEKIRAEFDRFLRDQAAKGFTQWAWFRKTDDAFIGRGGLDNRDYDQFNTSGKSAVELRYALMSNFWGKGYATELATALLDWAMEHIKPELFIAGCNPNYAPAAKLLVKLGFTPHQHVPFRDQIVHYHTLEPEKVSRTAPLSLKGLNVIAQTEGKREDEPYKPEQLTKYGLANLRIIDWLKATGKLVKQEDYAHNYPHCWRTDTPLIYRALPSWYVAVTKFRDRAVELNQQINWIPEHIRDGQMGHMLATAPDWSISRNRFWGTPIPIWRTETGKIRAFGSIAELEEFFRTKVEDLHRPFIEDLTKPDADGTWKRVSDVFDCWFESGSMPFAQVHYPFENKEWFETHFPADFITEYVGQTRGWFNTLIMLSTALFDKPPFKNCICHGVVLDAETGLKYSKRLKNYKDPLEVINQFGADALRWLMISSPVMRGSDLMVDPEGKFIRDVVRLHIKPIWNAYNFFTLYANADGVQAKFGTISDNLMDRYILAKCREAVEKIRVGLDAYDTPTACEAVSAFFEVLNNWYIRRNKDRFWNEDGAATDQAAYDTLYTVLVTMCQAAAPLLPMTCEAIYQGLCHSPLAGESNRSCDSVGGQKRTGGKTDFATEKAQEMRKNSTDAERKLWDLLRGEKTGYKFRRQQPIGNYIVDFYCAEKRLAIEVDGSQHAESSADTLRTEWLKSQGLTVLRFWNNEVLQNAEGVYTQILNALQASPHAVSSETAAPPQGGSISSVHLCDFPDVSGFPQEAGLIANMDRVRDICNAALAVRNKENIRVRQPLSRIQIIAATEEVSEQLNALINGELRSIVSDEVNVKVFSAVPSQKIKEFAEHKLKLNNPILGKRLPEKMKQIIPASKQGQWELKEGKLHVCGEVLLPEEYELNLEPKPGIQGAAALSTNDALVVLDLNITPELKREGYARDFIRMVQQARKDADLNVSDRIALTIETSGEVKEAIAEWQDSIKAVVLATSLTLGTVEGKHVTKQELEGTAVTFNIKRHE